MDEQQPQPRNNQTEAARQRVNSEPPVTNDFHDLLNSLILNKAQLKAIRLFCCTALPNTDKEGIQSNKSFPDLFQSVIIVNPVILDSGITREELLRLILESIGYNMNGLDWLPKCTFDASSKNFDMILTVAVTIMSMKKKDYKKFERLQIKQNGLAENQSRFDLACALLDKKSLFEEDNISIVFDWLQVSGCSSHQQKLRDYCKRHGIKVSETCCCLVTMTTLLIFLVFSITSISVGIVLVTSAIDVNVKDPQNQTHPIGLSTTVKLDCFNTSITDLVEVTAITLDNATIYTIPEDEVSAYPLLLPYINLNDLCILDSSIHPLPIPVSYNTCFQPVYTASGGGTIHYSIDLVNSNPDRVSCAMRLLIFSNDSDYISYKNVARDPQDDPPPSVYNSSDCVGSNGTHSFSISLPNDSLIYFVLAVVNHTTVDVNVSGNISAYSNTAGYRVDKCHLTQSNKSCSIVINPKKSRYNRDVGSVCLFGNSTYAYQGKVNLFTTFITRRVYPQKYWIPLISLGVFTLFFLLLLFLVILYYLCECYKRRKRIAKAAK